jgi:hypothetical protein
MGRGERESDRQPTYKGHETKGTKRRARNEGHGVEEWGTEPMDLLEIRCNCSAEVRRLGWAYRGTLDAKAALIIEFEVVRIE